MRLQLMGRPPIVRGVDLTDPEVHSYLVLWGDPDLDPEGIWGLDKKDTFRLRDESIELTRPTHGGPTQREAMWSLLDSCMDNLMDPELETSDTDKSYALAVAQCLALMESPVQPDIDAVRERAMERWTERQAEED